MPAPARTPLSRPHSAPAYYLARPASVWITTMCRPWHPPVTDPHPAAPPPVNHEGNQQCAL